MSTWTSAPILEPLAPFISDRLMQKMRDALAPLIVAANRSPQQSELLLDAIRSIVAEEITKALEKKHAAAPQKRFITVGEFVHGMMGKKNVQWFYQHRNDPGFPQRIYLPSSTRPALDYEECVKWMESGSAISPWHSRRKAKQARAEAMADLKEQAAAKREEESQARQRARDYAREAQNKVNLEYRKQFPEREDLLWEVEVEVNGEMITRQARAITPGGARQIVVGELCKEFGIPHNTLQRGPNQTVRPGVRKP